MEVNGVRTERETDFERQEKPKEELILKGVIRVGSLNIGTME
jgi:hypothetical protein